MSIYATVKLNEQQKRAVEKASGTFLVCAGAGSGKTRIITARIANLVAEYTVEPQSIVALTFTNKSAREMLERVHTILNSLNQNNSASKPFVGTFHSYCLLLLKRYADHISIPRFSILDDDDQEKLIKKIISTHELSKRTTPSRILSAISGLKNSLNGTQSVAQAISTMQDPFMREIALLYEHEKTVCRCYDFDDLLINTVMLLQSEPYIRSSLQNSIKHILVDEYQDTNRIQHKLLQLLALSDTGEQKVDSLCVVGDEDQSIYSWRGATIDNIIQFKKAFPNTQLITIDQNYRSVQHILSCANALIEHNDNRNPKQLWSEKLGVDRVRVLQTQSPYQEADVIASCINSYRKKYPLQTVAVLYRSHYQSRPIEEALIKKTIPYRIIGGIQFYKRLEVKDLVAYLRLVINPFDKISFSRIINTPQRGLGEKSEEIILHSWQQNPFLSCFELVKNMIEQNTLVQSKNSALEKFLHIFEELTPQTPALTALMSIIENVNYIQYLNQVFEADEAETKIQNVKELISSFDYDESKRISIATFVEQISLLEEMGDQRKNNNKPVTLMTFHAAKGLEFDCVILPGLEETVMPASRSLYDSEALEEERRLLYVGITRAREHALLLNSISRTLYGNTTEQKPSRFLNEIPTTLLNQTNTRFWTHSSSEMYFAEWFAGKTPANIDICTKEKNIHTPTNTYKKNTSQTHAAITSNNTTQSRHVSKSLTPKTSSYRSSTAATVKSPLLSPQDALKKTLLHAHKQELLLNNNNTHIKKTTMSESSAFTQFKKYDIVRHISFGIGIVHNIEQKFDGKLFLTIKFGQTTKKIESSFVQKN
jgi:DNA helicase-2/ATP-dependent DNA helicase PcrA